MPGRAGPRASPRGTLAGSRPRRARLPGVAALLGALALPAAPAHAAPPETSPRPAPRPAVVLAVPAPKALAHEAPAPETFGTETPAPEIPDPETLGFGAMRSVPSGPGTLAFGASPAAFSLRPQARPEDIAERARAARAAAASPPRIGARDASVRRATGPVGALCGSPAILGEPLAPIPGRLRGCGVSEPMRVLQVAGVRLSRPAVMDCRTALTLEHWLERGAKPAVGGHGGGLAALQVAAGYQCRTRNNRPGARISEHGRGRAIDISALILADGRRITVLEGWGRRGEGRILRAVHAAACGPFGTVLGPDGDRHHRDHFHFDTTPRRSGAYCR